MSSTPDLLLHWASHRGSFSDQQWRDAVASARDFSSADEESIFRRTLLKRLRLLGHIGVFQNLYRPYPPCLVVADHHTDGAGTSSAFLVGARVPEITSHAESMAARHGCSWHAEAIPFAPDRLSLSGDAASLASAASALGIRLVHDASRRALSHVKPTSALASTAKRASDLPPASHVETYDLHTGEWAATVAGKYMAQRYKPVHGAMRYYYTERKAKYEVNEAGEAVFLAAWRNRLAICSYDKDAALLFAPTELPFAAARALCLASGHPPARKQGNRNVYRAIPPGIAADLLRLLGQYEFIAQPAITWLAGSNANIREIKEEP